MAEEATTTTTTVDVVIVGAGLSGLTAAREIQQRAGLSCVVLEATDRVGGRTCTVEASSKDGMVDLGAAWINDTSQSHMYALAREFGFDLQEQRDTGVSLHQDARGHVARVPHGEVPVVDEEFLRTLTQLVDDSDLENPHLGPNAQELDRVTLAEFAKRYSPEAEALATLLARDLLGVESDEMSMLYFVDYVKSGTGLMNLISDFKDGGQYLRNRQGNQTFSTRLAEGLKPGSIKLLSPVRTITQRPANGCIVETRNNLSFHCRKVIVSIPTPLYSHIDFRPPLPTAKQDLSEGTALGHTAKVILVFDRPWWREANLSGAFTSLQGPVSYTADTCVDADDQHSITCFMIGDSGRMWSKLPKAQRRQQVLNQFQAVFGASLGDRDRDIVIPAPVNVIEKDWSKEPWVWGNPCPVMPPGLMTSDAGKTIRAPFRNVHFVGTETALVWKGYMEGAVRSGIRGAAEVIEALSPSKE